MGECAAGDEEDRGHLEDEAGGQLARQEPRHQGDQVADERAGRHEERDIGQPLADARAALHRVAFGLPLQVAAQQQEDGERDDERGRGGPHALRAAGVVAQLPVGQGALDEDVEQVAERERADVERQEHHEIEERLARRQVGLAPRHRHREVVVQEGAERAAISSCASPPPGVSG
jgi:hypothetical protein